MMHKPMSSILEGSFAGILVSCLTICQLVLAPSSALAAPAPQGIPKGFESYLSRPDILTVKPKVTQLGYAWDQIKEAQLAFVAQLLEMYPKGTDIYFLARDSEHLYDIARLVTQGTPEAERMHLLNVSRLSLDDDFLMEYLKDNGVSDETLKAGKKVLFVDTGFAGTIPNHIISKLSAAAAKNFKTQLIVSENTAIPSSRTFLVNLNADARNGEPEIMHEAIIDYEHLPRYTDRSTSYVLIDGHYHPISPKISNSADGEVSKSQAKVQMADLAAHWKNPKTQESYKALRKEIRDVINLTTTKTSTEILNALASKLENAPEAKYHQAEAILRDVLDSAHTTGIKVTVDLHQLGLENGDRFRDVLLEGVAMTKHPELQKALENPEKGVKELIAKKDLKSLQLLLNLKVEGNLRDQIVEGIFAKPGTGELLKLQLSLVESADTKRLVHLSSYFFSEFPIAKTLPLYEAAVYRADPGVLSMMTYSALNDQNIQESKQKVNLLLKTKNEKTQRSVAEHIAKSDNTPYWRQEIRFLIETGDVTILNALSDGTFSKANSLELKDLIPLIMEKTNERGMVTLAGEVHADFYQTPEYISVINTVLKSKEVWAHAALAKEVLQKNPILRPFLRRLLEKASPQILSTMKSAYRDFYNPEGRILFEAMDIKNAKERKKFIDDGYAKLEATAELAPMSPQLRTGDLVQVKNQVLEVISVAGEGLRGIVFKVKDNEGKLFALKVARDQSAETIESLQKESRKAEKWKALNIPHAPILVQGDDFVLKTWVDGTNGEEIVERFLRGDASTKKAVKSLFELVGFIREQGAYVGDFRPANLMWTEKGWVVIDSGSIKMGMTIEEAHARWSEKFENRWKMEFKIPKNNAPSCSKIFAKAG
jgi:hypothetical protein